MVAKCGPSAFPFFGCISSFLWLHQLEDVIFGCISLFSKGMINGRLSAWDDQWAASQGMINGRLSAADEALLRNVAQRRNGIDREAKTSHRIINRRLSAAEHALLRNVAQMRNAIDQEAAAALRRLHRIPHSPQWLHRCWCRLAVNLAYKARYSRITCYSTWGKLSYRLWRREELRHQWLARYDKYCRLLAFSQNWPRSEPCYKFPASRIIRCPLCPTINGKVFTADRHLPSWKCSMASHIERMHGDPSMLNGRRCCACSKHSNNERAMLMHQLVKHAAMSQEEAQELLRNWLTPATTRIVQLADVTVDSLDATETRSPDIADFKLSQELEDWMLIGTPPPHPDPPAGFMLGEFEGCL